MLEGKNVLIIGARAGGYGASIARAAVAAGARVLGTSLTPADPREVALFDELGVELVEVPLRYNFDKRNRVFEDLAGIERWLRARGVNRLDVVIHAVAGGFPRQPSVMKAVADILKGQHTFADLATAVKRNVYYVNAGSFADTVDGLSGLTHDESQFAALTYRGDLPYFISPTKKYLEKTVLRLADKGKRTLIAALPEAWTQSSQFFTGIEIAESIDDKFPQAGRQFSARNLVKIHLTLWTINRLHLNTSHCFRHFSFFSLPAAASFEPFEPFLPPLPSSDLAGLNSLPINSR